jgi:hypothetical protein
VCSKGHEWKAALLKKKRGIPLPGETGQRMMASWWSKEKGGTTMDCPKCKKEG